MNGITSMPLSSRRIFYTNIMLLGFDAMVFENQHKTPFDEDIFLSPRASNQRALEQVIYFLLYRVDAKRCVETFRAYWPIPAQGDKQYEKEFRSRACEWLRELATAEQFFEPKLIASVMHSPTGEKLYDFLVQLSTYVLIEISNREYATTSNVSSKKDKLFCLRPAAITKHTPNAIRELSERVVLSSIERNVAEFLDNTSQTERTFSKFRAAFDEHVRAHERFFSRLQRAEAALSGSAAAFLDQVKDTCVRPDEEATRVACEQPATLSRKQSSSKFSSSSLPVATATKPRSAASMFDEARRSCDSEAFERAYETRKATAFAADCVASIEQASHTWHCVDQIIERAQRYTDAILDEFSVPGQHALTAPLDSTVPSGKVPFSVHAEDAFRNAHDPLVRAAKRELRRTHAENVFVDEARVNLHGLVQLASAGLARHADRLTQLGVTSLPECVADWRGELSAWSSDFANLDRRLRELRDGFADTNANMVKSCNQLTSNFADNKQSGQTGTGEDGDSAFCFDLLPPSLRHSDLLSYAPKLAAFQFQPVTDESRMETETEQQMVCEDDRIFDLGEERAKLVHSDVLRNSPCKPRSVHVPLVDSPLSLARASVASPVPQAPPISAFTQRVFALTPEQFTTKASTRQRLEDTLIECHSEELKRSAVTHSSDTNRSLELDPDPELGANCNLNRSAGYAESSRLTHSAINSTDSVADVQATPAAHCDSSLKANIMQSDEPTEESWVYEKSETSFALETDNTDESASA